MAKNDDVGFSASEHPREEFRLSVGQWPGQNSRLVVLGEWGDSHSSAVVAVAVITLPGSEPQETIEFQSIPAPTAAGDKLSCHDINAVMAIPDTLVVLGHNLYVYKINGKDAETHGGSRRADPYAFEDEPHTGFSGFIQRVYFADGSVHLLAGIEDDSFRYGYPSYMTGSATVQLDVRVTRLDVVAQGVEELLNKKNTAALIISREAGTLAMDALSLNGRFTVLSGSVNTKEVSTEKSSRGRITERVFTYRIQLALDNSDWKIIQDRQFTIPAARGFHAVKRNLARQKLGRVHADGHRWIGRNSTIHRIDNFSVLKHDESLPFLRSADNSTEVTLI